MDDPRVDALHRYVERLSKRLGSDVARRVEELGLATPGDKPIVHLALLHRALSERDKDILAGVAEFGKSSFNT